MIWNTIHNTRSPVLKFLLSQLMAIRPLTDGEARKIIDQTLAQALAKLVYGVAIENPQKAPPVLKSLGLSDESYKSMLAAGAKAAGQEEARARKRKRLDGPGLASRREPLPSQQWFPLEAQPFMPSPGWYATYQQPYNARADLHTPQYKKPLQCFKCQQFDHTQANCPANRSAGSK